MPALARTPRDVDAQAGLPGQDRAPGGHARVRAAWPLLGFFYTYLAGWALGLSGFLPAMWGAVILLHLLPLRRVRFPRGLLLWAMFLVTVLASAMALDSVGRAVGFGFRLSLYVAAVGAFLYVYDTPERDLPAHRVGDALTVLWLSVVAGGFLAVLWPTGGFETPLASVLPGFLLDNALVSDWVRPSFAEYQAPPGAPGEFARPSAPLAYTNNWGANFALLLPFALATAHRLRGWRRGLLVLVLAASAVPAVATLNRGMYLAIAAGLAYVLVRVALRGRLLPLLGLLGASAAAGVLLVALGAFERLRLRTEFTSSEAGRASIYRETLERSLESPIIGWGAPRPSRMIEISAGTQGQIFNVMFSHGFIALALFVATFVWLAWATRHASGVAFAGHTTLVMVLVTLPYYGYAGPQLLVAMVAAALGMRQLDRRAASGALAGTRDAVPLRT